MKRKAVLLLLLATFVAAPAVLARGVKAAPTAPGTYKEWGPDIDQMEIVKSFKIADYDRIVVEPFDTSASPLPDDKSRDTIKSVLDSYTFTLVEALKPELKAKAEVSQADKAPKTAKTLVLRGKVADLSPGSRAKRYWGGFGQADEIGYAARSPIIAGSKAQNRCSKLR
jgi:hypothetical protein